MILHDDGHCRSRVPDPTAPADTLLYLVQLAHKLGTFGGQDTPARKRSLAYAKSHEQVLLAVKLRDPVNQIGFVHVCPAPWPAIWHWVAQACGVEPDMRVKFHDKHHCGQRADSERMKIQRITQGVR